MHQLHPITGQFRDASAEREFRASVLPKVQQDSRFALTVAAALIGVYVISDYNFLGLSPTFYQLVGARAVMVATCLFFALLLYSSDALLTRPWLYSVAPFVVATGVIAVLALRPHTLPTQTTSVVVTIMGLYLFVPNLIWGMVGVGVYVTAGFLFGAWYWAGQTPIGVLTIGLLFIVANIVSYLVALRLARLQREQFALLKEERLSKQRLMEEVVRRETLEQQLRGMAQTDELTGLSNRRHFMDVAQADLALVRRLGRRFCLCMIDIDNFKTINDRWGHSSGDRVLREVANACLHTLRRGEPVSRFGGDEFVAALPGAAMEDARRVAERLREKVAALRFDGGLADLRVTVTIGLSEALPQEADLEPALRRADAALYQGKRSGRNVVLADSSPRDKSA